MLVPQVSDTKPVLTALNVAGVSTLPNVHLTFEVYMCIQNTNTTTTTTTITTMIITKNVLNPYLPNFTKNKNKTYNKSN